MRHADERSVELFGIDLRFRRGGSGPPEQKAGLPSTRGRAHAGRRDGAAAAMVRSAQEIGALSRTLVTSAMEGARHSNLQRARILDVVAMEEHIRVAAVKAGVNSRNTAARTEAVAEDTDRGNQTMEATTRTMQEMAETVAMSVRLMQEFVARMVEVDRIVDTIGGIAMQTNLLALNAAIEAAHAGQEGEGFNVIAQEIRQLSDRTSQSTDDIGEKISRMSASAKAAETALEAGRVAVEISIQQNQEVQRSFLAIRNAMHEVKGMSAEVAEASEKQTGAVELLSASVKEIDNLAAECTQEADASAEMSMAMVSGASRLYDGMIALHPVRARQVSGERETTAVYLDRLQVHLGKVEGALTLLQKRCAAAGAATVHGTMRLQDISLPGLHFGATKATDTISWVDQVNAQTGCVATVFVCDGSRLVRAATNVKRADGQRATGTALNPKGLAASRLLQGLAHHGAAYVLGKPFLAAYEPVLSAEGTLLGALYVGRAIEWEKHSMPA